MKGIEKLHPRYQEMMRERYLGASKTHQKQMISLLRRMPSPEELSKSWILSFLERDSARGGKLSSDSIRQYLIKLKVVVDWLGRPELVEGIAKPKARILTREDILEPSEVRQLIQAAPNSRTRALIHLLGESGARIDEALSIKLKDIVQDGTNIPIIDGLRSKSQVLGRMWKIQLSRSKTYTRPIYVYDSTPTIYAWMIDHPSKKGPLFVSCKRKRIDGILQYGELSYEQAFIEITNAYVNLGYRDDREVTRLKKGIAAGEMSLEEALKMEMSKPPIPRRRIHIIRHAVGTQMAKDNVNPNMMNKVMGWSQASQAPNKYIHLVDEDVEEVMRQRFGLSEKEDDIELGIKSWHCPVCGTMNPPTTSICLNCPPKPQALNEELEKLREDMELMKLKNTEEIATLAAEIATQLIKKKEAQE
jgi:integrase